MEYNKIKSAVFGVRLFCGIHNIYSGAVIRGDRQGLCLYGKFEASRCGTHLLLAGSPIAEVRHRRILLQTPPFRVNKNGCLLHPFFCYGTLVINVDTATSTTKMTSSSTMIGFNAFRGTLSSSFSKKGNTKYATKHPAKANKSIPPR